MGWQDKSHVDIAAMKAERDSEDGRLLVALFGSASNYRGRKPQNDDLPEIPSDVDGLYGILERTRESWDPVIDNDFLDRDIGWDPAGRADTARRLFDTRFTGFRQDRFDVLLQSFCQVEEVGPYARVIIGAPVWVATPRPHPMGQKRR